MERATVFVLLGAVIAVIGAGIGFLRGDLLWPIVLVVVECGLLGYWFHLRRTA